MIDVIFTTHNRLAFTQASFEALIANTNWDLVSRLRVLDDRSTDGTWEWLDKACQAAPAEINCSVVSFRFNGPVSAMGYAIKKSRVEFLAKVDNDVIVCPGWLDALHEVMQADRTLGALGFEPGFGDPVAPVDRPRSWRPGPHIGGIGLIRMSVFSRGRMPRPNGKFGGWTEYQRRNGFRKGWVSPDLPCFLLDHLPFDPWRSLAAEYVAKGWSRSWPLYDLSMHPYWSWWTRSAVPA